MKLDKIIATRAAKTVYRDGDLAIKVFNETYGKAGILSEALNQALVEDAGLNVPKLVEVTKLDNKWAIVYEYIDGKTIEELMIENPHKSREYIDIMIDVQMKIFAHTSILLTKHNDRMKRKITESDFDANTKYDLFARLASRPKGTSICHGDIVPSNIVIKEDGSVCILDWSHATLGDPAADGVNTYMRFWLADEKDNAEYYLDAFCSRMDITKSTMQKWMPIVAAAKTVGCRPTEREFLLRWINVVENYG